MGFSSLNMCKAKAAAINLCFMVDVVMISPSDWSFELPHDCLKLP